MRSNDPFYEQECPFSLEGAHESNRRVFERARWLSEADYWLLHLFTAHKKAFSVESARRYASNLEEALSHIKKTLE